uniref:Uncharacterized protein n=1 Tax=Gopherus agassizii TaxID=38772 RepID=A0A452HHF4_9SAUR
PISMSVCLIDLFSFLVADPKYVIIGVTLGVFLAIGFLALKICMIKRQLIDNDFVGKRNILFSCAVLKKQNIKCSKLKGSERIWNIIIYYILYWA